jgi:hypothetical protein
VDSSASVRAKVELDLERRVPRRFYDFDESVSGDDPRRVAEAFLMRVAGELRIDPDLSGLRFEEVRRSVLGTHVLFQQQDDGRPVTGAWVRVDVDPSGRVFNVQNDLMPAQARDRSTTRATANGTGAISGAEAVERARAATGTNPHAALHSSEQVAFPVDGRTRPAWKVVLVATELPGEWKVYVDAASGDVLGLVSLLKQAQARVFDPHPVATLNDTSLRDDTAIPDGAYSTVELVGLDGSGHLDGTFVSTVNTPGRVQRDDGVFLFTRADRAFKEVMVYFHIDRAQRYIQSLGFDNVLNHPIKVNVVGRTDDNSDYSPTTKALRFGTGGVDDAEDAEIILHEYGHAVQDDQVPGFGAGDECGAMGEAFGDYLAASFFADTKPARLRPCVGSWDAVSYSGDDPPSLRRLDSNKKYPRDLHGEVHDDGEIWSACLWQIREALGGRTADHLVIAHHFLLTPHSTFEDAGNALITVDRQLNDGRNVEQIRTVFIRRGIFPNPERDNMRAGVRFAEIVGRSALPSSSPAPEPVGAGRGAI